MIQKFNKINFRYTVFLIGLSIIYLSGCSANVSKNVEDKPVLKRDSLSSKKLALSFFLNGNINEMKDQYAEAILEYQDALQIDSSAGIYFALSRNYFRLKKIPQALFNIQKAIRKDSLNTTYYHLLGKIYSVTKNLDSAEAVYKKVISLDSTDYQAYFSLAQIYESKKPLQALNMYKKLLDLTGPEWTVLIRIADLNERLGKIDETIKTVENLLALNPSSLQLQKILADAYLKSGKAEKALALVDDALKIFPDDLRLIELKGNALVQQNNWSAGAKEYSKLITNKNLPFKSKLGIGAMFLSQAMKDSSVLPLAKDLLQKIDKDSSDWQIKAYLGEIALHQRNDSLAIEYFRQSSRLANWNAEIWTRLGGLLFDQRRYSEAIDELSGVVSNFPENFPINLILGLSYAQLNDHKSAIPYLKKATELKPDNVNANMAYAFSLHQLNDDDNAIVHLNKVLGMDSLNTQAWGMLGLIYDNKKMYDKCDSAYQKALSIDSTDVLLLNNYAYSLAERGIKLKEALKMVSKSVEKEPENSSYLDTMGWVYYRLGNYEKALKFINKAIKIDHNNSTLFEHLGDVYSKMNKKNEAIKMWNNALSIDSANKKLKQKIEAAKS